MVGSWRQTLILERARVYKESLIELNKERRHADASRPHMNQCGIYLTGQFTLSPASMLTCRIFEYTHLSTISSLRAPILIVLFPDLIGQSNSFESFIFCVMFYTLNILYLLARARVMSRCGREDERGRGREKSKIYFSPAAAPARGRSVNRP